MNKFILAFTARNFSLVCAAFALLLAFNAAEGGDPAAKSNLSVTIYSSENDDYYDYEYDYNQSSGALPVPYGYAIVKDERKIKLVQGRNQVSISDVAASIAPDTVFFESLTDPANTFVIEQNFEYDLVDSSALIKKYLDKDVKIITKNGETTGKLLAVDKNGFVLNTQDALNPAQIVKWDKKSFLKIVFPQLPEGLIVKPTLKWDVLAAKAGEHKIKVAYRAEMITWSAAYGLALSDDDKSADMTAWVTINNQSGAGYPKAKLKLVAGNVNKATSAVSYGYGGYGGDEGVEYDAPGPMPEFQEQGMFEYHLYTLSEPTDVKNNQMKQIQLFAPVKKIPVEKIYYYNGSNWSEIDFYDDYPNDDEYDKENPLRGVDIYLTFKNAKENGLGIPLPKGKIRIFKKAANDGADEFVGEDKIDHTPKDEEIKLRVGKAFDVVGRRVQTKFEVKEKEFIETYEITIKNHKEKQSVSVKVAEPMFRWKSWRIAKSSHKYAKENSRFITFNVNVKPNSETKIAYTVIYDKFPKEY